MKTTLSRNLMIMLFPLLAPLAVAEPMTENVKNTTSTATEGNSSSWRASDIIGTNVKTSNDDTIGEVEDLIVDFKSGEILGVVISTGGFLGIADTLSSVPPSALRYDARTEAFKTKLTKEQLEKAPQYKKDTWQASRDQMGENMRSYRDSMGADDHEPDNSARNQDQKGLTAMDQGNSEADINRTKEIRQSLMNSDGSFDAKNIKIITRDGKVTLRGVVNSSAEHEAVLAIAKKHADASMISDQLEVKSKK